MSFSPRSRSLWPSAGTASAQPKPETSVHRLRNVAATDAAQALTAFANQKKLPVAVVAEPVSNTVMVAGDAASVQQMAGLLASLDKEPPSVCVQMQVMETMDGFAENGSGCSGRDELGSDAREVRMLSAAIRTGKQQKEVEIISEPRIIVADNQKSGRSDWWDPSGGTSSRRQGHTANHARWVRAAECRNRLQAGARGADDPCHCKASGWRNAGGCAADANPPTEEAESRS